MRELLTNYGRIDLLWFDGGWERTAEEWQSAQLHDLIRSLQPEILINDRLPGYGDFDTPEQPIPARPPSRAWETCLTINESWGYNRDDTAFKSPRQLIHALCEVAGKGGNLLLNVSPLGDGRGQPEQVERLAILESWMARNGESILDTEPGLEPWQFYGPSTRRGDRVYLHLLMRPYASVTVRGVPVKRVRAVSGLASGAALSYSSRSAIADQLFNPDPLGELRIEIPEPLVDVHATVVAIDFSGSAYRWSVWEHISERPQDDFLSLWTGHGAAGGGLSFRGCEGERLDTEPGTAHRWTASRRGSRLRSCRWWMAHIRHTLPRRAV